MRTTSLCLLLCASCNDAGLPAATVNTPPAAPPISTDPQSLRTCNSSTLAFTIDHDLRYATNGTARTVYTFASQLPSPQTSFLGRVDDVKGDRVLADGFTYYSPEGMPAQTATELVLLDTQGNVLWHRTGVGFGTPYLAPDGTLAVWDTNEETLVVSRDGSTRAIAGKWSPVAPAADGSLLVQAPPPAGDGQLGWLRPGQTTVDMLALQPEGYEEWVADRLTYVAKQNGQDVLVLATPDRSQLVALPGDGASVAIAGVAGHWLEAERFGPTGDPLLFRVDVETGEVTPMQNGVPAGMRAFDAGARAGQLVDDGSLLAAFRNDYVGSLYRSTDGGAMWTPIGYSIANVQGLGVIATLDQTIVAMSLQQVYAANSPWSVPPAGVSPDVSGKLVELARPADGIRFQLPPLAGYKPVALGNDGLCAAYWTASADQKSGSLEVLDVKAGQRAAIAQAADVTGAQAPLWLD